MFPQITFFLAFTSFIPSPKKEKVREIRSWRSRFGNIRRANCFQGATGGKRGHLVALTLWRQFAPSKNGWSIKTQWLHVYVTATATCTRVKVEPYWALLHAIRVHQHRCSAISTCMCWFLPSFDFLTEPGANAQRPSPLLLDQHQWQPLEHPRHCGLFQLLYCVLTAVVCLMTSHICYQHGWQVVSFNEQLIMEREKYCMLCDARWNH